MTSGERVACPDCSLEQVLPALAEDEEARCTRCLRLLKVPDAQSGAALALTLGALLLWIPGCLAPLLTVSAGGASHSTNLVGCALRLWGAGYPPLSVLLVALMLAIPSAFMLLTLAQALPNASNDELRALAHHLRPWLMLEVFVVGGCVAYSRIQTVATANVDIGGWCLAGSAMLLLGSLALRGDPATLSEKRPRRGNHSLQATTALVLTGLVLYIPANVLPVLQIERYGSIEKDTILGGVVELVHYDLWPLAVIVFMASVVVPLAKLFGLAWLLWQTRRRSPQSPHLLRQRTRVYRLIDSIGRWSNIDVFMISILGALVQFGALERVRPERGALAFAGVVLITMIAAQCFDPRLMWADAVPQPASRT